MGKRGSRIEYQAGFTTLITNQLQTAIDMLGGLGMEGDVGSTRLGKIWNYAIYRLDHHMDIDIGGYAVLAQCLTHQGTDGQVRYVVIIHYVEVHDISTRCQDVIYLFAKTREISRKNRGGNLKVSHDYCLC